ncbi:MAG: AAA family ATPase [Pseudomonadota bacterium]
MLIILSGLPGVGKTTLARALSMQIEATYLRIDAIEQAITNSVLKIHPAEDAGYLVGYALAEENLRLGRTVVADSVNPIELTRQAWLKAAHDAGQQAIEVEVICSDSAEHRKRVESRVPDLEGHQLPTWQEVIERDYEPWDRERIIVDTAGKHPARCAQEVLEYLSASP